MRSEREESATFTRRRRSARLAALFGFVALGLVAVGARRGRAEPATVAPLESVLPADGATPAAPTPPQNQSGNADEPAPRPPVPAPSFQLIDATWDRPIRVLPAAEPGRRALVYLHGYCGDVNAVGAFVPAAAAHGTLLALLGDQPCSDKPGRFKWSGDIHGLNERIQRAVRLVNRALSLELDS